ncbi:hypothetical protein G6011_00445 [Alternaria panax]|uniref:Uncharacterized protein n=1 Tax=Alternaria panax TaxID=48097 RepID=A0AAD4NV26_9PLEO|nr:hypothetical protein G6011_00445 [Alternaria panax]
MVSSPSMREQDEDDYLSDLEEAQSISGSNIDPGKLATLLRIKFGAGTYDIHVNSAKLLLDHCTTKTLDRRDS